MMLNKKCILGLVLIVTITYLSTHHNKIPALEYVWTMEKPDSLSVPHFEFGYVMATHYADQMTGAAANLVSLQCWASTLGPSVRVVEPFVIHSRFGVNLYAASNVSGLDNSVRLRDVFDIKEWERQYSKEKRFASLISWNQCLTNTNAQRKLILVFKECSKSSNCMNCKPARTFHKSSKLFAMKYNFTIIRSTCLVREILTEEEFKVLVYGSNDPKDVVVMFSSWGGVQVRNHTHRVGISGNRVKPCRREDCLLYNPVSKIIIDDTSNYLTKYMPGSMEYKYISVMIRLEYFQIRHDSFRGMSVNQALSLVMKCFDSIVCKLNELKRRFGINDVFLTSDCSKYGSSVYQLKHSPWNEMMIKATTMLYERVYNGSFNLSNSDEIFDKSASSNTPGYVAILHKHLAAKGACVLTAGGGQFQSTARELHSTYHPSGSPCAIVVPNC